MVHQRPGVEQPGREAADEGAVRRQRPAVEQAHAVAHPVGRADLRAVQQPVVVRARHALGPALAARGPEDGHGVVGVRGSLRLVPRQGLRARLRHGGRRGHLGAQVHHARGQRPAAEGQHLPHAGVPGRERGRHRRVVVRADARADDQRHGAGAPDRVAQLVLPPLGHHRARDHAQARAGQVDAGQFVRVGHLHDHHVVLAQAQRQQRGRQLLDAPGHLGPAQALRLVTRHLRQVGRVHQGLAARHRARIAIEQVVQPGVAPPAAGAVLARACCVVNPHRPRLSRAGRAGPGSPAAPR